MGLLQFLNRPANNSTVNDYLAEVIGSKADTAAAGAVTVTDSLVAYIKQLVTAQLAYLPGMPMCVEKSDGAVLLGTDDIFVVTGVVKAIIVGYVSTVFGGATNLRLTHVTTVPSATINLNAGAVACNTQAAGSIFYNVGATSVFTPAAAGTVILDPVTVQMTEFILTPGTTGCLSSAAGTGNIKWYMSYVPLTPSATVTAAA